MVSKEYEIPDIQTASARESARGGSVSQQEQYIDCNSNPSHRRVLMYCSVWSMRFSEKSSGDDHDDYNGYDGANKQGKFDIYYDF